MPLTATIRNDGDTPSEPLCVVISLLTADREVGPAPPDRASCVTPAYDGGSGPGVLSRLRVCDTTHDVSPIGLEPQARAGNRRLDSIPAGHEVALPLGLRLASDLFGTVEFHVGVHVHTDDGPVELATGRSAPITFESLLAPPPTPTTEVWTAEDLYNHSLSVQDSLWGDLGVDTLDAHLLVHAPTGQPLDASQLEVRRSDHDDPLTTVEAQRRRELQLLIPGLLFGNGLLYEAEPLTAASPTLATQVHGALTDTIALSYLLVDHAGNRLLADLSSLEELHFASGTGCTAG